MAPGSYLGADRDKIKVTALRDDADTPHVIPEADGMEVWLSDALAEDVVKRIKRALSILPTSK